MSAGRHADVRLYLVNHLQPDRRHRQYLLDRMQLGVATLAEGYPEAGRRTFERIFDTLRTQGINADRTVASIVISDRVRFWKGEPFEQAMAYLYVGMHHAMRGDWSNLRAAADNALFHLRDFGEDETGRRLDNESIVYRALRDREDRDTLESFTAVRSNLALAWLLSAVANQQMGRREESDRQFDTVVQLDERLVDVVDTFRDGDYDTVLVVEFGRGPRKVATGPDGAIARFEPMLESDDAPLIVTANGRTREMPLVLDVNRMAQDHRWNNLEDMRTAKSRLGSLMMAGGTAAVVSDLDDKPSTATWGGLGLLLAGAAAKGGARADTEHCELLPQRVYVAPLRVSEADEPIALEVESDPSSRLLLTGLTAPPQGTAQLRLIRLVSHQAQPPAWARTGRVHYANDRYSGDAPGALPFILGGRCVRRPSAEVLADYQRAGHLERFTVSRLRDLYRSEGISWDDDDAGAQPRRHVLEGGTSLAAPLAGTAGFARLFCQEHLPYRPRGAWAQGLQVRAE